MEGQDPNQQLPNSNDNKFGESLGKRKRGGPIVRNVDESVTLDILFVQIGAWKREITRHHAEIQLKCYFKKKKFLWEVLDGTLQRKVEYNWSALHCISFAKDQVDNGAFILKLKNLPSFFEGNPPAPTKHAKWKSSIDFTDNNASLNWDHVLWFKPKAFSKLQERITKVADMYPELYNLLWPPKSTVGNQAQQQNLPRQMANNHWVPPCQLPHHQAQIAGQLYSPPHHVPRAVQCVSPNHQVFSTGNQQEVSTFAPHQVSRTPPQHQRRSVPNYIQESLMPQRQVLPSLVQLPSPPRLAPHHQDQSASHEQESSKSPPQQLTTLQPTGNERTVFTAPSPYSSNLLDEFLADLPDLDVQNLQPPSSTFSDLPDEFFAGLQDLDTQNPQPPLSTVASRDFHWQ